MSAIYIPGMEMPTAGELLCINIYPDGKVCINLDLDCEQVATATSVPDHGRLIDADAPIEVWEVKPSDGDSCSFRNVETTVSKFLLSHLMGEVPPTIIPASWDGQI